VSWLLDTNVCIRLLKGRDSPVPRRLALVPRREVVLCSISKAELYYGAYRSTRREANLSALRRFFQEFGTLAFDEKCEEVYGVIRARLSLAGTPIGPNDLLIAAVALANEATLVTHNTAEFGRVSGLRIEDWESTS
jgi:tRNA(fMet)-specific endonuclease VapC